VEKHVGYLSKLSNSVNIAKQNCDTAYTKFRKEERGSILIFSLFILILMLLVSGMAVDLMRAETQRSRLQSTLDRAVLAGASLDQALDSEAVVEDYFAKAGLADFLTDVEVIPGDNSKTVVASAFMEVDSYFMHMMGIDNLSVPAGGTAEESLSNIEISLILDVSGSMGSYSSSGQRKIQDLIDAAQDFVYLMQCNPDDTEVDESGAPVCTVEANTVSISLVPYAEQVLVGEDLLQHFNVTNEHTASSCADFTTADFSRTDIPLPELLNPSANVLQRTGNHDARSNSNSSSARSSSRTCRTNSYRQVLPFSNSWTELQAQIDDLNYGGYTSIDLAMKWGTALLDPAFRPVVVSLAAGATPSVHPGFADRPYDFGARSMQKVVVLMTDGKNTSQYELKPSYRDGPSEFWYHPATGKRSVLQDNGDYYYTYNGTYHSAPYSDSTGASHQLTYPEVWAKYRTKYYDAKPGMSNPVTKNESNKNGRLNSICSAAKGQDIEVFTIGFETSSSSSAVMRNCASSDAHHFDATGLNLDNAFTSIAREIHELRLTN